MRIIQNHSNILCYLLDVHFLFHNLLLLCCKIVKMPIYDTNDIYTLSQSIKTETAQMTQHILSLSSIKHNIYYH
jgi:hypothetical protein